MPRFLFGIYTVASCFMWQVVTLDVYSAVISCLAQWTIVNIRSLVNKGTLHTSPFVIILCSRETSAKWTYITKARKRHHHHQPNLCFIVSFFQNSAQTEQNGTMRLMISDANSRNTGGIINSKIPRPHRTTGTSGGCSGLLFLCGTCTCNGSQTGCLWANWAPSCGHTCSRDGNG